MRNEAKNELPAFGVLWLSAVAGTALVTSSNTIGTVIGAVLLVFSLVMCAGAIVSRSDALKDELE